MPDVRSQAGLLIKGTAAKASEVFDEQGELAQPVIPAFYKVRSDDAAQYNVSGLSGPGGLVARTEQGQYDASRRYKTNDTNYIHTTYSRELEVSMRAPVHKNGHLHLPGGLTPRWSRRRLI